MPSDAGVPYGNIGPSLHCMRHRHHGPHRCPAELSLARIASGYFVIPHRNIPPIHEIAEATALRARGVFRKRPDPISRPTESVFRSETVPLTRVHRPHSRSLRENTQFERCPVAGGLMALFGAGLGSNWRTGVGPSPSLAGDHDECGRCFEFPAFVL